MWHTPAVPYPASPLVPLRLGAVHHMQNNTRKSTHALGHLGWGKQQSKSGTVAGPAPPTRESSTALMRSCHLPASSTPDTAAADTHTCQNDRLLGSQACPQPNSVGSVNIT